MAVEVNFENPPYAPGSLIGQDGWVTNAYVPGGHFGGPNGNVTVSNSSPLVGSQSLRYEQTAVTGGAGSPGASDVSKPNLLSVTPGILGTDLTVSYQIKQSGNSQDPTGFGGVFLSHDAFNGASPIFVELRGSTFFTGDSFSVISIDEFTYFAGDTLAVQYDVDFDASKFTLSVDNLTTGSFEFARTFNFFAPFAAEGALGEYLVDVGVALRRGTVQIDNLSLVAGTGPVIADLEWNVNASGNWNAAANWDPSGVPGSNPGKQTAIFGAAITSPQTVFTNSPRVVNRVEFDSANAYAIAGKGSVDFQADDSAPTPTNPSIAVTSGNHQFQLAVNLLDDTTVTVAGGASLDFNNQIDLNGNTLTTTGNVRINHSTIGGGTVQSLGALEAADATNIGGNLVSSGSLLVDVDAAGGDLLNVLGDATLSGLLDVVWDAASLPTGPLTILSAGGSLDVSGLALAANDARTFALGVDGNHLTLTYLGTAVPEPASVCMFVLGLTSIVVCRSRRARSPAVSAKLLMRDAVSCVALMFAGLIAASSSAAVVNFENPLFAAGALIGQQGWNTNGYIFTDPFFGGVVNGTVDVSAAGAISGSQSLLYTQTSDPPGSGGPGGSDVGLLNALFGTKDGTTAIDLNAKVKLQADANGQGNGHLGFALSPGGGRSPIFVRLDNASNAGGTGEIQFGEGLGVSSGGAYHATDVIEFSIGVDFDNENFDLFQRNVTAGTAQTQIMGTGPGGRIPFFFGGFADDGDGQTYSMDIHVSLRSGVARADDVDLLGDEFTRAVWRSNASGDWQQGESWIPNMAPGASQPGRQIAVFGGAITGPQTVFTNSTMSVNGVEFNNANSYVIAGTGHVALKANTVGTPVNPTVSVASGSHEFQVAVDVLDNTAVSVAAGAFLDFNGNVALGGKTLTTSGAMNLNVGVTGGGAIANSGTLGTAGATPIAANLASTGTLQVDLGAANIDRFNITGTATLSGLLDVVMEPGFTPTGSYTVLTSTGTLNAAGLALHPSDLAAFTLSIAGNSVVLVTGGSTTIPGDFDGNGTVNGADLAQWKGDFGVNDDSNADGDNDSDGNDFLIWQRNLGQSAATPTAASVPEPASVMLAAMTLVGCRTLARRRRR